MKFIQTLKSMYTACAKSRLSNWINTGRMMLKAFVVFVFICIPLCFLGGTYPYTYTILYVSMPLALLLLIAIDLDHYKSVVSICLYIVFFMTAGMLTSVLEIGDDICYNLFDKYRVVVIDDYEKVERKAGSPFNNILVFLIFCFIYLFSIIPPYLTYRLALQAKHYKLYE